MVRMFELFVVVTLERVEFGSNAAVPREDWAKTRVPVPAVAAALRVMDVPDTIDATVAPAGMLVPETGIPTYRPAVEGNPLTSVLAVVVTAASATASETNRRLRSIQRPTSTCGIQI